MAKTSKTANPPSPSRVLAPAYEDIYSFESMFSARVVQRYDEIERMFLDKTSGYYTKPYGLFEEVLLKDPHLRTVLDARCASILSLPRVVVEAEDGNSTSAKVKDFVESALEDIGNTRVHDQGFEHDLMGILDCIGFGVSIMEIIPQKRDGDWGIESLISRHPRRFSFSSETHELRLLTIGDPIYGIVVPSERFVYSAPYGQFENPYGWSHIAGVFFPSWLKKHTFKWWAMYVEKLAGQTLIGKYPTSADQVTIDKLEDTLLNLKKQLVGVMEDSLSIDVLETAKAGAGASYREFIGICNSEISKGLTGSTGTVEVQKGEGGGSGTAEAAISIRKDIVHRDAQMLSNIVTKQIIRRLVDWNFPVGQRLYPKWTIITKESPDLGAEMLVDRGLHRMGIDLSKEEMYTRYGRTQPDGLEDTLEGFDPAEGKLMAGNTSPGQSPTKPSSNGKKGLASQAISRKLALTEARQSFESAVGTALRNIEVAVSQEKDVESYFSELHRAVDDVNEKYGGLGE